MITIDGMTVITIEIILIMTVMIMIFTQVGDGEANGGIETGGTEDHLGETDILIDLVGGIYIQMIMTVTMIIFIVVVITDLIGGDTTLAIEIMIGENLITHYMLKNGLLMICMPL